VPDGLYYIRVRGVNSNGAGLPSNEVRLNVNRPEPPNPPLNLTSQVTGNTVTLSWQAPTVTANNPATSYIIEAGTGPGLANIVTVPLGNVTTFGTSGVPPGRYFVRVRAANAGGAGDPSNEVVVTVP
jgi:predicted phage tail protein